MARSYLPVDRDQQFLLPPSMREWLSEGHLVWFVIEVVERVDTSVLHARHPNDGVGRRAYNPDMLLALLIYAYCTGVRSSRRIERLCEVDVAYRVLCGGQVPDHSTIARFRQEFADVAVGLFADVLQLCAAAGLASVGVVAVDGTKMAANASLKANRSRAQLEAEIRDMFAEADEQDAEQDRLFGDARGDELPPELADPRSRAAHLDAARRELERRQAAREAEQEADRKAAEEAREQYKQSARSKGRKATGRVAVELDLVEAEAALASARQQWAKRQADLEARWGEKRGRGLGRPRKYSQGWDVAKAEVRVERARQRVAKRNKQQADRAPDERVNITDSESRIMPSQHGWVQGYNAQAAVNELGIALAAEISQAPNDVDNFRPMTEAIDATLAAAGIVEPVGVELFDAGYCSEANLVAPGPDRLIATSKSHKLGQMGMTSGPPPEGASPVEAMQHRLRTREGHQLYRKRQHTIEPVFGTTKEQRGYRRFVGRGLATVRAEWKLIMTANNVNKLFNHRANLSTQS
jgi:transposase